MTDHFEHNPQDHEDPDAGMTWTVGVIGSVLLLISVLGVAAIYQTVRTEIITETVVAQPQIELEALTAEQIARLEGPVRMELRPENPDGERSLVIPVEQAMELIAREAGGS